MVFGKDFMIPKELLENQDTENSLANLDKSNKKFKCSYCGKEQNINYFIETNNDLGFLDENNKRHILICKDCLVRLYQKLNAKEKELNQFKSLYYLCALTNTYYNDRLAHKIFEEDNKLETGDILNIHPVLLYFLKVSQDKDLNNKEFFNSDNLDINAVLRKQLKNDDYFLTEKDRKNRRAIIAVYHSDPFLTEPIEDRPALYEDLITMTDEAMADDLVRQKAAVEVVRCFYRADKINIAIASLQADSTSMVDNAAVIKTLLEQKAKEMNTVTQFSKDHGFAEKYANAKSKGSGTLGAIVRDINEYGYDKGAINKFDIDTNAAMKQVSDISAESIFKQISFTATDYADMVKEQAVYIRQMQETMEKQAEELRLYKEKHLKAELLEELRQQLLDKEIDPKEVDELVKQELLYRPSGEEY